MDISTKFYNNKTKFDPIICSLLDTDFYKLLMLQMIWNLHKDIDVEFTMINRSKNICIANEIEEAELRSQLDHARTLRFTKKEIIWLAGNKFYGRKDIFSTNFLDWLQDFQLPEYDLKKIDGEYHLVFAGKWPYCTMWEIPTLSIINELRSRSAMQKYGPFELDILYSRAKLRLWNKIKKLQKYKGLYIADFGTRRRHSFLWQNWCIQALKEGLDNNFVGSSNVFLAMENDLEAVGTNAHELPMVYAAIAEVEQDIINAPYRVMKNWQKCYNGNLLVALPDVFGTEAFLRNAPNFVKDWRGFRPDSEPPIAAGERLISWWQDNGLDPKEKLIVFSDGLDDNSIISTYEHFKDRVQMSFGWGTNLTNDFTDCSPLDNDSLAAISLVCKVTKANGKQAVKLTDNISKATGDPDTVSKYIEIFK